MQLRLDASRRIRDCALRAANSSRSLSESSRVFCNSFMDISRGLGQTYGGTGMMMSNKCSSHSTRGFLKRIRGAGESFRTVETTLLGGGKRSLWKVMMEKSRPVAQDLR